MQGYSWLTTAIGLAIKEAIFNLVQIGVLAILVLTSSAALSNLCSGRRASGLTQRSIISYVRI